MYAKHYRYGMSDGFFKILYFFKKKLFLWISCDQWTVNGANGDMILSMCNYY